MRVKTFEFTKTVRTKVKRQGVEINLTRDEARALYDVLKAGLAKDGSPQVHFLADLRDSLFFKLAEEPATSQQVNTVAVEALAHQGAHRRMGSGAEVE